MPSPIGHALAGVAIAWAVQPPRPNPRSAWKVAAVCAGLAILPDIDLVHLPIHRTATHSIPVGILVTIIAIAVTGWVIPEWGQSGVRYRSDTWRIGLACGLAWSSHVLLDWLGADANPPQGIQMLWPFSDQWYHSGWDLFPGTERRQPLSARGMARNLRAALQEVAIMGSIALAVWLARRRSA
jgi:membrane-bound metal-dependent hydrolase YbcI (DUF457 family)